VGRKMAVSPTGFNLRAMITPISMRLGHALAVAKGPNISFKADGFAAA
jgi:hypothetical protein